MRELVLLIVKPCNIFFYISNLSHAWKVENKLTSSIESYKNLSNTQCCFDSVIYGNDCYHHFHTNVCNKKYEYITISAKPALQHAIRKEVHATKPICKKYASPQKVEVKKMWNPRWQPKMAVINSRILIATIQVNLCCFGFRLLNQSELAYTRSQWLIIEVVWLSVATSIFLALPI